jgi:hypothetical protein
MRVDGGVSLNVQFMSDRAPAAAEAARPAGAAASAPTASAAATARAAGNTLSHQAVLLPRRTSLLLIAWRLVEGARQAGYAPDAAARASASDPSAKATVTSPLDFLRDSRLSAEEKLVLLLAQQQKDVEKEIEAVLKKAEAKSAQKKSSGGGLLKSLNPMNVLKSALPGLNLMETFGLSKVIDGVMEMTGKALSELTGPVLAAGATALGMPSLAPLAMSVGSRLAEKALDLENALSSAVGGEAKATANAPNAGTGSSNALDPVETQRLTLLVNRQQQWAGTVSNLLHATHQTRMNIIQNLR